MMSAIEFVIRTRTGTVERGSVGGDNQGFLIDAGSGNDISLNIRQSDLRGYDRAANDLLITLADGRVIVLEGYFDTGAEGGNRLFLSSEGILNEVSFVQADGGTLYAQYGPTETWGKWGPSEDLIFVEEPRVAATGYGADDEVSMLAAPLLGALGTGAAGIGAAGLGGLALLGLGGGGGSGSGGGGGGDGGGNWTPPTVDEPDAVIEVGGGDEPRLPITGTANPGSTVTVTAGDEVVTGVAGDSGTWEVVFEGETFPADGEYVDVVVVVTDPNGTVTELDGPTFVIDTTPPAVVVAEGAVSTDDLFNAEGHASGVSVSGTAEAGSTVTITVGEHTQTMTATDGTWSFSFDATVLPAGEYVQAITITATDAFGNTTVITDGIEIDTIATVALTNAPLTGDDRINAAEHGAGVTLTGTSQAGSSVMITIEGVSQAATVAADGSWTVTFDATMLPAGTYTTTATIIATDAAGNTATTTHGFSVDTENSITVNTATVEVDGIVNGAERSDGVVLTGTAEAGATVVVTVGTTGLAPVTAGANGTWSVNVPQTLIPTGETTLAVSAVATDAVGNTASTSGSIAIDTVTSVTVETWTTAGNGMINGQERLDGVTLTGEAEPGATVTVTIGTGANGVALQPVTAGADGTWSVEVSRMLIPTGVGSLAVSVSSVDAAGNTATAIGTVAVDTETTVSVNTATVAGDGTINAAERLDGTMLTGQAEPGATVVVTVGTGADAHTFAPVTANANGQWSVSLATSMIPTGTTSLAVSAVATDVAGNTAQTSGSVAVDTEISITAATGEVTGDSTINYAERATGVPLSGTSEPGAVVEVFVGANAAPLAPVTADANGNWTVQIPTGLIPSGQTGLAIRAEATDAAGNTATTTGTIPVDTLVDTLNMAAVQTADGPVSAAAPLNLAEAQAGVTLTGQVEAGSTVMVTLDGTTFEAAVSGTTWTLAVPGALLEGRSGTLAVTVEATDLAMNTREITGAIAIDTTAPEAPEWIDYTRGHTGLNSITTDTVPDAVEIGHVVSGLGGLVIEDVTVTSSFDIPDVGTYHRFASPVADGSHLVVSYTDDAGNTAGSLFVTDDPATNAVTITDQLAQALGAFQVETIDLQFAEDSHLTITEAQILALSDTTDTVAVLGGADDSVTITGATQGGTTTVDGQGFNVFTLGDATILIDDEITNVNTGVV